MRYAVISDIHSNIEALAASLSKIDTLGVKKIICLGDIVGYNANPNECLDVIKKRNILCVMGNHDSRVVGLEDASDFNYQAASAAYWTREVLTEENKEFLRGLPRSITVDNKFLAVHGWINDTDRYILGGNDALKNFTLLEGYGKNICFFGHTHVPISYLLVDGSVVLSADNTIKIAKGVNYLINPGGLGQPRDRDPRASFLVYDSRKNEVNFHRVEYDVKTTAEKIIAAGLPERLAERLKLGW